MTDHTRDGSRATQPEMDLGWLSVAFDRKALLRIRRATAPAIPARSMFPGSTAVLLRGIDGNLHVLTSAHSGVVVHAVLPNVGVGTGEVFVDHAALAAAVRDNDKSQVPIPVANSKTYSMTLFVEPAEHTLPTVARIDAARWQTEMSQVLRTTTREQQLVHIRGVRVYFDQDAVVLRGTDNIGLTVVRIPAEVTESVIGQCVMLTPEVVQGFLHGQQGDVVEIALNEINGHRLIALRCPNLSMSARDHMMSIPDSDRREVPWDTHLFTQAAQTTTVDHQGLKRAIKAAASSATWKQYEPRTLVVHLTANPIRVTWGGDDDADRGPVIVADDDVLLRAVMSFKGPRIALHRQSDDPRSKVMVTDPDVELGAVTSRHHVFAQVRDPRPSQRARWLHPRIMMDGQCVLQPRGLRELRLAFAQSAGGRHGDFGACVSDASYCLQCPMLERLRQQPYVPPLDGDDLLVEVRPAGSDGGTPVPWLTSLADPEHAIETTWDDLAALGPGWQLGAADDPTSNDELVLHHDDRFPR